MKIKTYERKDTVRSLEVYIKKYMHHTDCECNM